MVTPIFSCHRHLRLHESRGSLGRARGPACGDSAALGEPARSRRQQDPAARTHVVPFCAGPLRGPLSLCCVSLAAGVCRCSHRWDVFAWPRRVSSSLRDCRAMLRAPFTAALRTSARCCPQPCPLPLPLRPHDGTWSSAAHIVQRRVWTRRALQVKAAAVQASACKARRRRLPAPRARLARQAQRRPCSPARSTKRAAAA